MNPIDDDNSSNLVLRCPSKLSRLAKWKFLTSLRFKIIWSFSGNFGKSFFIFTLRSIVRIFLDKWDSRLCICSRATVRLSSTSQFFDLKILITSTLYLNMSLSNFPKKFGSGFPFSGKSLKLTSGAIREIIWIKKHLWKTEHFTNQITVFRYLHLKDSVWQTQICLSPRGKA